MRHPMTTTLTLLLVAAQRREGDYEHHIYKIVEHLIDLADWSDERKADLYARLAETVNADDRMTVIEEKVAKALARNAWRRPDSNAYLGPV